MYNRDTKAGLSFEPSFITAGMQPFDLPLVILQRLTPVAEVLVEFVAVLVPAAVEGCAAVNQLRSTTLR
jgi:hypothetical protein